MSALMLQRFTRFAPAALLVCSGCLGLRDPEPVFTAGGGSVGRAFEVAADGIGDALAVYLEQLSKAIREHPTELRLTMEQSCEMPLACPAPPDPDADPHVSVESSALPCIQSTLGWNAAFQEAYVGCLRRCETEPQCLGEALFLSDVTATQLQRKSECEAAQSSCAFPTDACMALAALNDDEVVAAMQACVAEPCETRAACFTRVLLPELQWAIERPSQQHAEPEDL